MKTTKSILLILILVFTIKINAQDKKSYAVDYVGKITSMTHVPSIASQNEFAPAITNERDIKDGRSSGNIVVPGKDPQTTDDYFSSHPDPLTQTIKGKAPSLVFDAYSSSSMPTDPSLAVGPNHVFVVFNTGFIIFDKDGNDLTGEVSPNPTIFPNGGCCDLTASYDAAADRWVITFLGSGSGAQIAVSDGPDPVNDGWYVYTISSINDYQKLSVWSDGYYITDNTTSSNKVWALERDKMLIGDTSAKVLGFNLPDIVTSGFYSPQAFNVSNSVMPATGSAPIVYMQDDAWSGVANDHVKLWEIDVDWDNTANSTITAPQEIPLTPFIGVFDNGNWQNIPQPGGGDSLDALQATIMNQAQFRKFSDHNSAVFDFVVDTDASSGKLAGVRWIELRQTADGEPWSLYQEGTYTAADGKHAWNASVIMDAVGNIGMGYTAVSGPTSADQNVHVSSYYTGRFANDPLGTMTITEELIANGDSNISGTRYGDYSKIDIDPEDDKTFWFIDEYKHNGRKGVVGAFRIAPNFNNDIGAISINDPVSGALTSSEEITITVFNYGEQDASNFDVSYQIDSNPVVTETFTGTIASATSAEYTFSTTADFSTEGQVYTVTATTGLSGDEDTSNDSITQEITHLFHKDVGVTAFVSPASEGDNLGMETITIQLQNFGALDQSNFDVSYTLDGITVTEQYTGTLSAGTSATYTFSTQGDFSAFGNHDLSATTLLSGDSDTSNDAFSMVVYNAPCNSGINDTPQNIGPDSGMVTTSVITISNTDVITDLDVTINLNHTYDGDLDIYLIAPDGTRVELSTDNGSSGDNYIDTVFDNEADTSITEGTAPFTGSFKPEGDLSTLYGMTANGDWTLEITDDANVDGGTLNYWSIKMCDISLDVYETAVDASDLLVKNLGDNLFDVSLTSDIYTENLIFNVYDLSGKELVNHVVENKNGTYQYPLDMSHVAPGVYILRMGNEYFGKVKRIIVK